MTLRIVKPDSKGPSSGPPPPVQPDRKTVLPWLTRRLALWALVIVLVVMGLLVLGFGFYLSRLADSYELTLRFGARTTRVQSTNVQLTEGEHETNCVLSLLEVRELRASTAFLLDVEPGGKVPRGSPTFEVSLLDEAHATVNTGTLPKEQLEPIDAWIIRHASACIKKYEMQLPTPVR